MKHINMEEFAGGAFTAQINRAMEEVTKNIQDPNTDATAVRKITVVIAMKRIREYLEEKLEGCPVRERITIIA